LNTDSDEADLTSLGRPFHTFAPAAGKARPPTVERASGFMDDVIFAHKPRLLDVAAQLKRSAHAALGLAINCAQYQLQANGRMGPFFGRLK